MHELPPDPEDLLALARLAQSEPDALVRARVRRGVASALVAGAAVSVTAVAAARVAAKGASWGAVTAKLAAGAAVCAVALGVFLSSRSQHAPRAERQAAVPVVPAHVAAEQRAPVQPPSAELPTAAVEAPPPSTPREVPSSATRTGALKPAHRPSGAPTPSLRAELMLLDQAERAIDDEAPGRALTLLERHRARFVSSSFAQEREGLSLIARCMTARAPALAEATRFLSQAGGGVLHDRVRAACLVQP